MDKLEQWQEQMKAKAKPLNLDTAFDVDAKKKNSPARLK